MEETEPGLPADSTIAAAVAYTMRDLHQERAALDYPLGGSDAVVQALVRGVTKSGRGVVQLNSHGIVRHQLTDLHSLNFITRGGEMSRWTPGGNPYFGGCSW